LTQLAKASPDDDRDDDGTPGDVIAPGDDDDERGDRNCYKATSPPYADASSRSARVRCSWRRPGCSMAWRRPPITERWSFCGSSPPRRRLTPTVASWTMAGSSARRGAAAGIDMSLHVVGRLPGGEVAEKTARQMEYPWQPAF
jgi:hypothetical protein